MKNNIRGNVRFYRILSLVVTIICLLECSSWASMTGQYMYESKDRLIYLRISQTYNGWLSGYIQHVIADESAKDGYNATLIQIEGRISGTSISFSKGVSWEGTYRSGKLTVQFPVDDGRIVTWVFKPISTKYWNNRLSDFKSRQSFQAYKYNWNSALWNRQHDLIEDNQEAQNDLESTKSELRKHQDELQQAQTKVTKTQERLLAAQNNVKAAKEKLKITEEAAKNAECVAAKENTPDASSNANELNYAANEASNNLSSAEYDVRSVEYDLGSDQKDLKESQEAVQADKNTIESLIERITQNTNELHYLTDKGIMQLKHSISKNVIIGRVIYKTLAKEHPNLKAKNLYRANQNSILAVLNSGWDWCPILLPENKICWISSKAIRIIDSLVPKKKAHQHSSVKVTKN